MTFLKELARRLRFLLHPTRFNTDLADELQFHIDTRADELEATGLSHLEALSQARREFGLAARTMQDTRAAWQFVWLADLIADLRYGIRALLRQPGFALAATLSLALGIGANTTIFSLTMEALFSEPSCRRPQTLVNMRIGGNSHSPMREYRFIRDARTFEGLAGEREESEVNWRNGDQTRRLFVMRMNGHSVLLREGLLARGTGNLRGLALKILLKFTWVAPVNQGSRGSLSCGQFGSPPENRRGRHLCTNHVPVIV